MNGLFMSLITTALLLPALYRRHVRRQARAAGLVVTSPSPRQALGVVGISALLLLVGIGGAAHAADDPTGGNTVVGTESVVPADTPPDQVVPVLTQQVAKDRVAINTTWLMLGGILVLFMQAGFALVETGFTRAKNASHTMMMNLVIFALGVVGWFVCGYALMFGATGASTLGLEPLSTAIHLGDWNILGKSGFFLTGRAYDVSVIGFFFFQLVFMDATATIPTGAMAERWKWSAFCVYGLVVSAIIYPIYANWAWGGGWLSQLGKLGFGGGYA
ncbi:MAG: ammonium transporter, Amt family, partial [Acidimicrobiaceae bacterium]